MSENNKNRYWYLNRPPAYGHQPDGFVNREGGLPSKEWVTSTGPLWSFGFVEYDRKLTFDEVYQWELTPDNPVEWAHYQFWQFANSDVRDQCYYEEDYVAAYKNNQLPREDSNLAKAARILYEAQQ